MWRPVIEKYWRQCECDTYDFHDLVAVNSVITVVEENKRRADDAAMREQERNKR